MKKAKLTHKLLGTIADLLAYSLQPIAYQFDHLTPAEQHIVGDAKNLEAIRVFVNATKLAHPQRKKGA